MNKTIPNILLIPIFALFLNIITVLLGGENSTVIIINGTDHLIDINCDGAEYFLIEPNHRLTHSMPAKRSVNVQVKYSSDQDVQGHIEREFYPPYTEEDDSCVCGWSSGEGWHDDCVVTPAQGGSVSWTVSPADFESIQ
jgi:hypothetical protein